MFSPKLTNAEIYDNKTDIDILSHTRREILLDMPLLSGPLSVLVPMEKETCLTFMTEGIHLYYQRDMIRRLFRDNPLYLRRLMLHQTLHCLYLHPWHREGKNPGIWSIACDISVERTIDKLGLSSLKRPLSLLRKNVYEHLEHNANNVIISPGFIYNELLKGIPNAPLDSLQAEFYTDDHGLWPLDDEEISEKEAFISPNKNPARDNWEKQGRKTSLKQLLGNDPEKGSSNESTDILTGGILKSNRAKSYKYFLHHFMSVNEKSGISTDEFDLAYYSYGLDLYGNAPLIEPLEAYEDSSLMHLIIIIDTSYSTKGETVLSFLQETGNLLREEGLWARGGSVRLLQCDDDIRSDIIISTYDDMDKIFNDFHITGGGNTDFRPPFTYINNLIRSGKSGPSPGVLYFTDGLGIYPKKDPGYKTAFLFTGDYDSTKIPPWAMHRKVNSHEYKTGKTGDNKHI